MSDYIDCGSCGASVLSFSGRCPRCGEAFTATDASFGDSHGGASSETGGIFGAFVDMVGGPLQFAIYLLVFVCIAAMTYSEMYGDDQREEGYYDSNGVYILYSRGGSSAGSTRGGSVGSSRRAGGSGGFGFGK